jgi:hypothetical protein
MLRTRGISKSAMRTRMRTAQAHVSNIEHHVPVRELFGASSLWARCMSLRTAKECGMFVRSLLVNAYHISCKYSCLAFV